MINKHEFKKISISEIKPYDRNARTHSTEQVKQIMDAIKEWGFTNPLLIDEQGNLIAGHGRLEAVKQLNKVDFKDEPILELPAIVVKGLSDSQKKALIIADNQIALNAGWDYEVLALELKELESVNYDLDLLAFDNVDEILGEILNNETGRKPRLSIRMFRKGENVKYRKFICDLDYQSADNDLVMNNIEPSTSSIVIRFKHDLTKNMKFTFSIENVGL